MQATNYRLRFVTGITFPGAEYGSTSYGYGDLTYGQVAADPASDEEYAAVPWPAGWLHSPAWTYRRGDTRPQFKALVVGSEGNPLDFQTSLVSLLLTPYGNGDSTYHEYGLQKGDPGFVYRDWELDDLIYPGTYRAVVIFKYDSGRRLAIRFDDRATFVVTDDSAAYRPRPPAPSTIVITLLTPNTAVADEDVTVLAVTITGTGFRAGADVEIQGTPVASLFVSDTEIQVPFWDVTGTPAGVYSFAVRNVDEAPSNSLPFTLTEPVAPPANVAPTAAFTSSATFLAVNFDGSTSSDPDGTIVSYSWDFGDGSPYGTGVTSSHTYATAGTYTVVLTIFDDDGAPGTVSHDVTVTAAVTPGFGSFLGSQVADASGSTLVITTINPIAAGDLVVVRVAADNLSATTPTFTCADSGGNSYTTQVQKATVTTAASGVAGAIMCAKATNAVATGGTITVTLSGAVVARATYAESLHGFNNTTRSTPVTGNGVTGPSCSSGASGTVNAGDLVLGFSAVESHSSILGSSDTTNGAWQGFFTLPSMTGGTASLHVEVTGEYKIPNAAGAQTYSHAISATDWVAGLVVLQAT